MTQSFYWTPPGGVEVALAPPSYIPQPGREGFDSIPASLYDARAPYQQGATPLGGSFEPRELFLPLVLTADTPADMAVLRRATTRLFAPNQGVGILRWVQDDGTSWVIRCEPSEGVAFGARDAFDGYRISADVTLAAKDPFWYEATLSTLTTGMFTGGFALPLSFPVSFGTAGGVASVNNLGDVATPCTITLTGPASYPVLSNLTTGDAWGSTCALLPGEQLIVSSVFGAKSALIFDPITGLSTSTFATVRPSSKWIELIPGVNRIAFTGSGEASKATMTVSWYNRYLGA